MISIDKIYAEIISNIENNLQIKPSEYTFNTSATFNTNTNFNEILEQKVVDNDTNNISSENINYTIEQAINEASQKYNIDKSLISAIIKQESNFDQYAVSSANAMGLMQIIPQTANYLGIEDPYSINENINGGTKYLRELLDRYGQDEQLALAAYNAGPSNVDKYGGIPPFEETQNYVPKVLNFKEQYNN